MQEEFRRIQDVTQNQLNPHKRYIFKDTYTPQDLNPYKRAKQRVEKRADMIKNLQHKGTLESSLPHMHLTDAQVLPTSPPKEL